VIELSSQALVPTHGFELAPFGVPIVAETAYPRAFAVLRRDSPPNRATGAVAGTQNYCPNHPRNEKNASSLEARLTRLTVAAHDIRRLPSRASIRPGLWSRTRSGAPLTRFQKPLCFRAEMLFRSARQTSMQPLSHRFPFQFRRSAHTPTANRRACLKCGCGNRRPRWLRRLACLSGNLQKH
jgi:hypothetical protein